jgi:hypothetical protein
MVADQPIYTLSVQVEVVIRLSFASMCDSIHITETQKIYTHVPFIMFIDSHLKFQYLLLRSQLAGTFIYEEIACKRLE